MENPHDFWLQPAERFLRKRSLKMLNLMTLGEGKRMTLTFDIPKVYVLI